MLGEERGERAQCQVSVADAARPQHAGDLLQVTAHRGGDPGDRLGQLRPVRQQRRAASPGAPRGRVTGEGLGVDGLGGLAVLGGQPVIAQVQVDPGGLDRGVPGLGLHRLQAHPGFAQLGQAGMPQLVAGAWASPARRRAPSRISSSPSADSGMPRRGPLSTTNTRSVPAPAGRSASR